MVAQACTPFSTQREGTSQHRLPACLMTLWRASSKSTQALSFSGWLMMRCHCSLPLELLTAGVGATQICCTQEHTKTLASHRSTPGSNKHMRLQQIDPGQSTGRQPH